MKKINIREALLKIDKETSCEYDLTTLYEACKLDDEDKHQLVKYIDAYDHPSVIGDFLASKCDGLSEAVEDDDVTEADMKKIINDINCGEDHTLWAQMEKADKLDEAINECDDLEENSKKTSPSTTREVQRYIYKKISPNDTFTADDSRYWDFDRAVREGDEAVLLFGDSKVPQNAKYLFSLMDDRVDMDFYLDRTVDNDTWYIVHLNPTEEDELEESAIGDKVGSKLLGEDNLEEGVWDDIKKVGKAVGNEIKNSKVYKNNIGAAKTAIKNKIDKVKGTDAYKNISGAVKDTDTYKNVKDRVDSAKQLIKDTKADNKRKPEDYMEPVKGKNYAVSDLAYTLNGKQISPEEYIKMNGFQRKRCKVTVPNGVKPVKESLILLTEDMFDYESDSWDDDSSVKEQGKFFADGSEDNWVVAGTKSCLNRYASNWLGYELHPSYLYDADDFAGDIIEE